VKYKVILKFGPATVVTHPPKGKGEPEMTVTQKVSGTVCRVTIEVEDEERAKQEAFDQLEKRSPGGASWRWRLLSATASAIRPRGKHKPPATEYIDDESY